MADGIFAILSPSHINNKIVTVCHNEWLIADWVRYVHDIFVIWLQRTEKLREIS
jgi:hypothetical protein